jgi:hypothetical protein
MYVYTCIKVDDPYTILTWTHFCHLSYLALPQIGQGKRAPQGSDFQFFVFFTDIFRGHGNLRVRKPNQESPAGDS